jgi:hypothetical protein
MSRLEWTLNEDGNWAATADGKVRATVHWSPGSGMWVATAIGEHSDTCTSFDSLKEATLWAEDELCLPEADAAPEPEPEPEPEPAETEEERLEREFQEACAKWADKHGRAVDLCRAIRAGYATERCGFDDDMVSLLIDLGDYAANIVRLADAAHGVLAAITGREDTELLSQAEALQSALHAFRHEQTA